MYDTEMKLNHQIVQFVETQLHELLPPRSEQVLAGENNDQNMHAVMLSILVQYLSGGLKHQLSVEQRVRCPDSGGYLSDLGR